jgi:hypothetical protein
VRDDGPRHRAAFVSVEHCNRHRFAGAPRTTKRRTGFGGAVSFIAGALVGSAIVIPILLIDLGERYGVLVLMVSLLLASAGIVLGALGSKASVNANKESSPE